MIPLRLPRRPPCALAAAAVLLLAAAAASAATGAVTRDAAGPAILERCTANPSLEGGGPQGRWVWGDRSASESGSPPHTPTALRAEPPPGGGFRPATSLRMTQDTTHREDTISPLDSPAGEAVPYDDDDESWHEDEGVTQTLLPAPEATPRAVPEAALARYRADPNFRYDTAGRATGPSLLDRFWDWFRRTYLAPVFERAGSRPGQMTLAIAGIVALLALLVWLARGGDLGVFRRRDGAAAMPYGGFLADIALTADDLDARLADARAAGQWREATRWRFLVSLRRLGAAGALRLDAHKTDGDYRREIRGAGRPLARAFADAADAFAWVWYGAAPLDADRYARVETTFDRLDAALAERSDAPRAVKTPVLATDDGGDS